MTTSEDYRFGMAPKHPVPGPETAPGAPHMTTTQHWVTQADHLRLGRHGRMDQWWRVRAALGHYAVVTRQAAFHPTGTLEYAAIDFDRKVRGPVNLIGGGYGDGSLSDAEVWRMLAELLAGEIAVTYRNPAPLEILAHRIWDGQACNCHEYVGTTARPSNSGGPSREVAPATVEPGQVCIDRLELGRDYELIGKSR